MRTPFVSKLILGTCLTLGSAIAHSQSASAPQNDASTQRLTIKTKSSPPVVMPDMANIDTAKKAPKKPPTAPLPGGALPGGAILSAKQTQGATFGDEIVSAPHAPLVETDATGATARGIEKKDIRRGMVIAK